MSILRTEKESMDKVLNDKSDEINTFLTTELQRVLGEIKNHYDK